MRVFFSLGSLLLFFLMSLVGVYFEHVLVTMSSNLCQVASMSEEVWVKDQSISDRSCLIALQSALWRFISSNGCAGVSVAGLALVCWKLRLQSTMSWSERRVFSTETLWMELEWFVSIRSRTLLLCLVGSCTSWDRKNSSMKLNSNSTAALSGVEILVPGIKVFVGQFTQGRLKSPITNMFPELCFWRKDLTWLRHSSKRYRDV